MSFHKLGYRDIFRANVKINDVLAFFLALTLFIFDKVHKNKIKYKFDLLYFKFDKMKKEEAA